MEEAVRKDYAIVDETGVDVLLLEISILELSLKHQGQSRATIFVTNQDVTIVADLRDSTSQELLYRAQDRRRIADSPLLLMDAIEFWSNLERSLEIWATSLVEILDHATTRHAAWAAKDPGDSNHVMSARDVSNRAWVETLADC